MPEHISSHAVQHACGFLKYDDAVGIFVNEISLLASYILRAKHLYIQFTDTKHENWKADAGHHLRRIVLTH